jgi:hypothetical protein
MMREPARDGRSQLLGLAGAVLAVVATRSDPPNHLAEAGSGGGFGSCAGFTSAGTIYSGTLDGFTTSATNYGSGVGSWAPSGTANRVYRISYTLNASTPNSAQGGNTAATFQWESQA